MKRTTRQIVGAEQPSERTEQREPLDWEAVPRDGPAVLVVNARLLDLGSGAVGGWVRLDLSVPEIAHQVGEIIGGEPVRDFVVLDQLGIGAVMWEEAEVADLLAFGEAQSGSGATGAGGLS